MNQNLLLKYISGKASQREKEEVAAGLMPMPLISKNLCHSAKVMMHLFGRMRMS